LLFLAENCYLLLDLAKFRFFLLFFAALVGLKFFVFEYEAAKSFVFDGEKIRIFMSRRNLCGREAGEQGTG
jgi:hypothetical protein